MFISLLSQDCITMPQKSEPVPVRDAGAQATGTNLITPRPCAVTSVCCNREEYPQRDFNFGGFLREVSPKEAIPQEDDYSEGGYYDFSYSGCPMLYGVHSIDTYWSEGSIRWGKYRREASRNQQASIGQLPACPSGPACNYRQLRNVKFGTRPVLIC